MRPTFSPSALFDAMRKSWDRERSADLQFALKPLLDDDVGDNAWLGVPLRHERADHALRSAMDRRRSQRCARGILDIAPTLAQMLAIPAPRKAVAAAFAYALTHLLSPGRRPHIAQPHIVPGGAS
jgi:hypothetical protein